MMIFLNPSAVGVMVRMAPTVVGMRGTLSCPWRDFTRTMMGMGMRVALFTGS